MATTWMKIMKLTLFLSLNRFRWEPLNLGKTYESQTTNSLDNP
jgi:hypothetical protein